MLYEQSDEESDEEKKCELSDDESVMLSKSPALGKRRSKRAATAKKVNYNVDDSDGDSHVEPFSI